MPAARFDPTRGNHERQPGNTWYPPSSREKNSSSRANVVMTNRDRLEHWLSRTFCSLRENVAFGLTAHDTPMPECPERELDFRGDPTSWADVLRLPVPAQVRYRNATLAELQGLKDSGCIRLIPRANIVKGATIFNASIMWTTKFRNGAYDKTKCRCCLAGNRFDKSYTDCFAPVVRFGSVLVLICLSAMFGWCTTGLDFTMAYLNADLDEACFMRAPVCMREFSEQGEELYWSCEKAIYGHPKSGRAWNQHLVKALTNYGFHQFRSDQCVFSKWDSDFVFSIICVHTDDVLIFSNSKEYGDKIRADLLATFPGTDLGSISSFCGVQIKRDTGGISLSLRHYLDQFFSLYNITPLTGPLTPLTARPLKSECPAEAEPWIKQRYLKLTGCLIWIFSHCRLDLAYPIHAVTRVMHSPTLAHLGILVHLCRYVCATAHLCLRYFYVPELAGAAIGSLDFVFYTYCDSSFADDPDSMCSTGGYYIFLQKGQGAVSTKSFLAKNPALSSTEAEYSTMAEAVKESAWIKQFLDEMQLFRSVKFEVLEDNEPAINALRKNVSDSRFKHVRLYFHFVRDMIKMAWCSVVKISTLDQTADLCTKLLPSKTVEKHTETVMGSKVRLNL